MDCRDRFLVIRRIPGGFWFRVYGYGLHIRLAKYHQILFSERYGYVKVWYFAGIRFELLGRGPKSNTCTCGTERQKVIYAGLPVTFCPGCHEVTGLFSFIFEFVSFNGMLFVYEGSYLRGLLKWIKGE